MRHRAKPGYYRYSVRHCRPARLCVAAAATERMSLPARCVFNSTFSQAAAHCAAAHTSLTDVSTFNVSLRGYTLHIASGTSKLIRKKELE